MEPHQQRVVDEKRELDEKATKLSQFIGTNPMFLNLDAAEQERMKEQCEIMWQYSEILGKRIAAFVCKKAFAERGLIQMHWQKKDEPNRTELVCQGGDFNTPEEMQEWLERMVEKFQGKCPDGWQPLVCDSTSDYFWWAAPSA